MKIEYSDLYKFIVSLGVGLIALAFVIPWLFLREPFDLLQTQESLDRLTPLAKSIIAQRQEYLASILDFIPAASIALILLGIALSVIGIIQWWIKSQRLADKRQQLELLEAERSLRPAKRSDVELKIRLDASEELEGVSQAEMELFSTTASHVEAKVARILESCHDSNYKLLSNQRIGSAIFDFLLLGSKLPMSRYANYTIEVKYIRKGFKFGWLRDNLLKVLYLAEIFERETNLPSFPVLLIVAKENVLAGFEARSYTSRLAREMRALEAVASIVFIAEGKLDQMQCEELMYLIERGAFELNVS